MGRLVKTALNNVGNASETNNVTMSTDLVSLDVTLATMDLSVQKVVKVICIRFTDLYQKSFDCFRYTINSLITCTHNAV